MKTLSLLNEKRYVYILLYYYIITMVVQIQVSDETWKRLIERKKRPSHTFDGIISTCLDIADKLEAQE